MRDFDFGPRLNERFATESASNLLDRAVEWISEELSPEEVFTDGQLENWAYDNGFKRFE